MCRNSLVNGDKIEVECTKSKNHRCARCFIHNSRDEDGLCSRCSEIIFPYKNNEIVQS